MASHSPIFQAPKLSHLSSLSPHRLFQELWKAVEANDCIRAQELVDALVHMLQGNQFLAIDPIMELIDVAQRLQCQPEIVHMLTRLPGFEASITRN